jgi:NADH-quinone oxidoreductase subunit N
MRLAAEAVTDTGHLAPLLILALAGCVLLLLAARRGAAPARLSWIVALTGLLAATGSTLALFSSPVSQVSNFGGMLVLDRTALFMTVVILLAATLGVLLSRQYLERAPAPAGEYYALILFAALGMVVMSSTHNLLVLFMGLEILSVSLYVLAAITRRWIRSLEAGMNYFLLGAFSTGFILYGMALLYGATGSLDLASIGLGARQIMQGGGAALAETAPAPLPGSGLLLVAGLGLVLVGLAFKVAAVPFHWWAPDVYEGAPTPVTAFMAVGTKGAAFVALLRVVTVSFGDVLVARWTLALAVLALLSMIVGNLVALTQRNVKRLLAYSSVAHAGYLLVAVAAGSDAGSSAVLFYFASYLLTTLGAFGVVSLMAENGPEGEEGYGLLRYAGLGRTRPGLALAMAVFMISLIGVPPTSGFVGKYLIFQAAMERALPGGPMGSGAPGNPTFMVLAAVGILTSVISAAYYLRVIVAMYMQEPDRMSAPARPSLESSLALGIAAAGVLALGLYPVPIHDLTRGVHDSLQALAWIFAP